MVNPASVAGLADELNAATIKEVDPDSLVEYAPSRNAGLGATPHPPKTADAVMSNINHQIRSLSPPPLSRKSASPTRQSKLRPPTKLGYDAHEPNTPQEKLRSKSALMIPDSRNDDTKMRRTKTARKANKDFGDKRAGTVERSRSPKKNTARIPEPTLVKLNVSRGSQVVSRPLSV